MLKLTLDTNCIINLLDFRTETATSVEALNGLMRHATQGAVNLCITTEVGQDLERDRDDERRREMLQKLSMFHVIGGGRPVPAETARATDLEERIRRIVFPLLSEGEKRYEGKKADVRHLVAHALHGRDIFVTDDAGITSKQQALRDDFGIVVMRPEDALERVERTVDMALLAEDFLGGFQRLTKLLRATIEGGAWEPTYDDTYRSLRKYLLRTYPKLHEAFRTFRWVQEAQPTSGGNYLMMDARAQSALVRERDVFREFYEAESGRQTFDAFVQGAWSRSPLDYFDDRASRRRTWLEEFVGYLEART